ncbi:MAG: hypothetical protein K8T90_00125 [Planctomycetes bacterium]|nr:hypothetical protein [Planctomycetota bacterium]
MPFPRIPTAFAVVTVTAAGFGPGAITARADDETLRRQIDDMNRRMQEMETRHQREIDELKRSLGVTGRAPAVAPSALQEQIDRLVDDLDAVKTRIPASPSTQPQFRLIDVSLNALVTGGFSSADESTIQALQAGGHDPKKRGFTVQNVELTFSGAVDPYFTANANIVTLLSPEGETEVELEEACATTSSLPSGFQVKAGQFLTQFGRHNPTHPHAWDFVDVPVVSGRMLGGDGMRGPGVQVSWLGTDVPLELTAAIQNANGETMAPFLSGEPPVGAAPTRDVRTFNDMARSARAALSIDASDEIPVLLGVSGVWGPSGASDSRDARVLGADFTAKWRPLDAEAGFPFVSFRTEWLGRQFAYDTPGGGDTLNDSGWTSQATWGFQRDWTLGARYDSFSGRFDATPGLDDRTRWSAALTYYTSEFAKLRLQVNSDDSAALDDRVTSVWLQIEFNLGKHGAHKF